MTALLIDLDVILDIEEIVLEIVDLLTQDSETGEDNTSDWEMAKVAPTTHTESSMRTSSVLVAATLHPRLLAWPSDVIIIGTNPLDSDLPDVNTIILLEDWSDTRQAGITIRTQLAVKFLWEIE